MMQPNLLYDRQGIPICQQNDAADFDNLNLLALPNQIALPRERLVTQSGLTLSSYKVGQLLRGRAEVTMLPAAGHPGYELEVATEVCSGAPPCSVVGAQGCLLAPLRASASPSKADIF